MSLTVLITGANRGIGLGMTRKLLAEGHTVYAGCRHPDGARDLWELESSFKGRCHILEIDVTHDHTIKAAAARLEGRPLDLLLNNAGIYPDRGEPLPQLSADAMLKAFDVNTIGPIRVVQHLLENLKQAKEPVIATLSSKVGSIADNRSGGSYAYRTSKTAMNMVNTNMSLELKDVICVVLHPGWVATDMGGQSAPTSIEESANGLYRVITKLTKADSGAFIDFQGKQLPW